MCIGAHVSIDGGLEQAVVRAVAIGAECLQMFISPPQSWRSPSHSAEAVAAFRTRRQAEGITPVFLHSIYLINLASASPALRERSQRSLVTYLDWAQRLGVDGVITHLGSARDLGAEEAARLVVEALGSVLSQAPGDVPLLLETTAGPGMVLGSTFAELGAVIAALGRPERLRLCLDTAHVFASGLYDGTPAGLESMLSVCAAEVGLDRLAVVHLNDSRSAFASRVDRHANIGEGQLGRAGLRPFFHHPALSHLPFLLEVPGREREGPSRSDIAAARSLAQGEDVPEGHEPRMDPGAGFMRSRSCPSPPRGL